MEYIIAREGWPFIGVALALFIISIVLGFWVPIFVTGALLIFVIYFFRNPERVVPNGKDLLISPADGRVIKVEKGENGGTLVSIFMSVLNVHVNRIPLDGVVKKIEYNKGRFLVASRDKASLDNEQNAITIEDSFGRIVKFVQIAGLVARRIVCYLKEGDRVRMGERFGMIRFGSRLDVYMPAEFTPLVKEGMKVKSGATILGKMGGI